MGFLEYQIDLFSFKKSIKKRSISPDFSMDTLVAFRYHPRLKKSIRCNYKGIFGKPELALPLYMKEEAFMPARELAAEWALLIQKRKTKQNKEKIKEILDRFWTLVNQILIDQGNKCLTSKTRHLPIQPKGEHYDLEEVLAAVNETYFNSELQCKITWSNRIGGQSFHSIRKDPLSEKPFHLISISKGYDTKNCPFYAIAGVVYHECLHIKIPPKIVNGRRVVHGRDFKRLEKKYIFYEEWMDWHRKVLPLNLRKIMKIKK